MHKDVILTASDLAETAFNFAPQMGKESDRGLALICGAFLDDVLRYILSLQFVNRKSAEVVMRGYSSSRLRQVAEELGCISRGTVKDLEVIQQIRNDFAHLHTLASLNSADIVRRCKRLQQSTDLVKLLPQALGHTPDGRELFVWGVLAVFRHLITESRVRDIDPDARQGFQLNTPWGTIVF